MSEGTSGKEQSGDRNWRPSGNPWLIAIVVTLAAFMELLDTTIVNVSLPHIAGNLSASYDEATWTLTSYLVANSIVLPISAFFGRLIGRKRYFVICIAGVHGLLVPLRDSDQSRRAGGVSGAARILRRWTAAESAIDHSRHFSARAARPGIRSDGHSDGGRARARTHGRGMDHRQLQLALGLFHQCSRSA